MNREPSTRAHALPEDQTLVLSLAVGVRTAAYYDRDNAVLREVVAGLTSQFRERALGSGSVNIGVYSHCVFVDGARIRTTVSTYDRYASLVRLFDDWGISTIAVRAGVKESEVMALVLTLARETGHSPEALTAILASAGVEGIQVDLLEGEGQPQAVTTVEAYAAAVRLAEELRESSEAGAPASMRQVRHVTQTVVDRILNEPRVLIALTTIKEFDHNLLSHSVNVAILSVLLGQRLGLSKPKLGELCLAAFLHDTGKLEVSPEALHKPGPLNSQEWEEVKAHPVRAARRLLSRQVLSAPVMRAVVVAFEHHMNFDLSGYPRTRFRDRVSFFGSIVTIADRYDAMTTARPYRRVNYTPHEALSHLVSHAGTYFDPLLVKLFVEIMGLYPPGTVVGLSTGDLAIVCEPPVVGGSLDRPKVRLVGGDRSGKVVDLEAQRHGVYLISISRVFNPSGLGQIPAIDVSTLFEAGAQQAPHPHRVL